MEWETIMQIDDAVYEHYPTESQLCDTQVKGSDYLAFHFYEV